MLVRRVGGGGGERRHAAPRLRADHHERHCARLRRLGSGLGWVGLGSELGGWGWGWGWG